MKVFLLLIPLFSLGPYLLGKFFQSMEKEQPPILTLNDFVKYKQFELQGSSVSLRDTSIQDLLIEGMDHFVGVTCLTGDDFDLLKEGLRRQLGTVPAHIRDELVESAIIHKTSVLNVVQNSSKPLQTDGRASAYLGWWNTRFSEPSHYETCVMVSGITFTAAEVISGYVEEKRTEKVGVQPCQCGFFYCEKCPIMIERTYSSPIYKRHAISLKDHNLLHHHMVQVATDMATQFIQSSKYKEIKNGGNTEDEIWPQLDGWDMKNNKQMFEG